MKKRKKKHSEFFTIAYLMVCLIISTIVTLTAVVLVKIALEKNVSQRAFDDLYSKARINMNVIEMNMEQHFSHLHFVERILKYNSENIENKDDDVWNMIGQLEEHSTIGFMDVSGNAIGHGSAIINNICEPSCFSDILNGSASEKCVYLEPTLGLNDPRVIFSIPVYRDENIIGVLFEIRKISRVEHSMVEDVQFNGKSSMFVVDKEGEVVISNGDEDKLVLSDNIFDENSQIIFENITDEEMKQRFIEKKPGKCISKYNQKKEYTVYMPSRINDWVLFCMIDNESVNERYENSQMYLKKNILLIVIMFVLSLVVSVLMMILYMKKYKAVERDKYFQYDGYKKVMNELTCPVFEYDIEQDKMIGNKNFEEKYGCKIVDNFTGNIKKWKDKHPEYNFDGLIDEVNNVIRNRRVATYESVLRMPGKNPCWIKSVLIPVSDKQENVVRVFGTIMDTTQEHIIFENAIEMMSSTLIGLHRCYLSEPVHVEYVSEGFRKMLGYTEQELNNILGSDQRYTNLLNEADREKFEKFIEKLSAAGGIGTCEYRMICKDGTMLEVADTLEVKYGSNGIKYGYAVVTDISKYKEEQEERKKELEELEMQLNESRLKISTGQMQPHFLYNALASIREVVLENPEYAADLIYDFTVHLRACIKSMSSDDYILFSQEIKNIKAYVNIEKMRFGDKLRVEYDIREDNFYIVPLSIQPLVENAIRHGIYERGSCGGTVKVSSYRNLNDIIIEVEDDGVGFDVEAIKKEIKHKERDSTGLYSLIFRFEKLMRADVQIESKIGIGTKIIVKIPVRGE